MTYSKEIRSLCEAHQTQITSVRPARDTNARRIDVLALVDQVLHALNLILDLNLTHLISQVAFEFETSTP